MLLVALRKMIFYANEGCKILIDLFYCQPIYVGDGCVAYDCMELKHDDGAKFSTKGLIEFNATFEHSPDEILVLLYKPRTTDEIIALICVEFV